jgi:uncharacterized protein with NRDE domain
MCTILFSYGPDPKGRLILLANRDEFYERPTVPAAWWADHPEIYAGRDLVAGGTWLGVTSNGKVAAVTNYRDPSQPKGELSRGALVSEFLLSDSGTEDYLKEVLREGGRYTGFNLIAGRFGGGEGELFYCSNRAEGIRKLEHGLYGLSNHLLDTPWPKVRRGKDRFAEILENRSPDAGDLFKILADRAPASDHELPDTGVGVETEKVLSPIFIETPSYGTRSSTVVIFSDSVGFEFEERVFV